MSLMELDTACGKGFGCGAQLKTILGLGIFFVSWIVIASAKAWRGWAVALSILIIGIFEKEGEKVNNLENIFEGII